MAVYHHNGLPTLTFQLCMVIWKENHVVMFKKVNQTTSMSENIGKLASVSY